MMENFADKLRTIHRRMIDHNSKEYLTLESMDIIHAAALHIDMLERNLRNANQTIQEISQYSEHQFNKAKDT